MNTIAKRSFVIQWALDLWLFQLTQAGRMVAGGALIAGSIGAASLEMPLYHLFCALCGVLAVAYICAWLMRPALEIEGAFPPKAVAGQPVTGEFKFTNRARHPVFNVAAHFFALPEELVPIHLDQGIAELRPGESATALVTIRPQRRGLYPLPALRVYSTFPWHIFRQRARVFNKTNLETPHALLVLPHFHPVSSIRVPINPRYQPGGVALSSNIGESPEYIGNRDYLPGDLLRHIDHRSWGRLARPIVREYQEEYYCRVALVLDTYVPKRRRADAKGFPDLEAAVSLSASAAGALAQGEYIIDLFAAGPELYVFRSGRHTSHFESVLEILACVDAARENPFEVVGPALADELTNISSVIFVLLDWDASRAAMVRTATEAGCQVKVLLVRDGVTSQDFGQFEGAMRFAHYSPEAVQRGGIEAL